MSFLLDLCLLLILVGVVALYARRSIFAALTGLAATAIGLTAAVLLTGTVSPALSQAAVRPLVERAAANELADMYSAPHMSSGRRTVESLPLYELIEEEPEAYSRLLAEYNVDPADVRAAYAQNATSEAILVALTQARAAAFSDVLAFVLLSGLLALILRLIAHRIEQNFPPVGRYHGMRRFVPGLIGLPAGLIVLWGVVWVLCRLAPAVQGQTVFLSDTLLETADWFSLLRWSDPFLRIG